MMGFLAENSIPYEDKTHLSLEFPIFHSLKSTQDEIVGE